MADHIALLLGFYVLLTEGVPPDRAALKQGHDVSMPSPGDLTAAQGLVFVEEGMCLESHTIVHRVRFRASAVEPLSGVQLLLLRPVSGGYDVVFSTAEVPSSDWNGMHRWVYAGFPTGNEAKTLALDGPVKSGTEATVIFSWLVGLPGDCLGWYHSASGTGSIASRDGGDGQVRQAILGHMAVQDGSRLSFGGHLGRTYAISWYIAMPPSVLRTYPRAQRVAMLDEGIDIVGMVPTSTSPRFKRDLVKLFGSQRWAEEAALEVGACGGATTSILSQLFGLVYALELHTSLNASRHGRTAGLRNVVHVGLDTGTPYAFSLLAPNDVAVAIIDGDHHRHFVMYDTLGVLLDIPCCVEFVVYHDYCDTEVFETVQMFVEAGILHFERGVGEDVWQKWWCRDGRPEGALFRVAGDEELPDRRQRLERVRRRHEGIESLESVARSLNGSTWSLQSFGDYGILRLMLPPAMPQLRIHGADGRDKRDLSLGRARVIGWQNDIVSTRWAPAGALTMEIGRNFLVFDRDLLGFLFSAEPGNPLPGMPEVLVGVRRSARGLHSSVNSVVARTAQ